MQPKQRILSFIRRVAGQKQTFQQLQQLHQQQQQQQQQLLAMGIALGSGLKYFFTDLTTVKATTTYKRCAQIVCLLSPLDVEGGGKYARIGKDFDGGYVMLDNFNADSVDAAYSFGIASDVSWDLEIAGRGIDVFMYDHTIDGLPNDHPGFHYFKLGITGEKKGTDLKTLKEIIAQNGHSHCKNMIMKMDIEGCEWDVFQHAESSIIDQFSQIVVEFHDLIAAVYDAKVLSTVVGVLEKINKTHQVLHVHANGSSIPLWIGGLVMPDVIEVTYARRVGGTPKFVPSARQFPTELDQPTYPGGYDIYLGRFDCDTQMPGDI